MRSILLKCSRGIQRAPILISTTSSSILFSVLLREFDPRAAKASGTLLHAVRAVDYYPDRCGTRSLLRFDYSFVPKPLNTSMVLAWMAFLSLSPLLLRFERYACDTCAFLLLRDVSTTAATADGS